MTVPTTVEEAITENAKGPKRVQLGNQSVEQHSLADQIAADNHAKANAASGKNHLGLRFVKIIPPGAG